MDYVSSPDLAESTLGLYWRTGSLYLLVIGDYTLAWGHLVIGSLLVAVAVGWLLIPFVLQTRV